MRTIQGRQDKARNKEHEWEHIKTKVKLHGSLEFLQRVVDFISGSIEDPSNLAKTSAKFVRAHSVHTLSLASCCAREVFFKLAFLPSNIFLNVMNCGSTDHEASWNVAVPCRTRGSFSQLPFAESYFDFSFI